MACLLVVAWATIFAIMIRAVIMKDILWPQKQEDREEGGWKAHEDEKVVCDTRTCDDANSSGVASQQPNSTDAGYTMGEGRVDMAEGSAIPDNGLPPIAERLIEESVRGRSPRKNDSVV